MVSRVDLILMIHCVLGVNESERERVHCHDVYCHAVHIPLVRTLWDALVCYWKSVFLSSTIDLCSNLTTWSCMFGFAHVCGFEYCNMMDSFNSCCGHFRKHRQAVGGRLAVGGGVYQVKFIHSFSKGKSMPHNGSPCEKKPPKKQTEYSVHAYAR